MQKIEKENFSDYTSFAKKAGFGTVYPLSITEEIQRGWIFTNSVKNPTAALLWHYCGFAFYCGEYDEVFLEEIYDSMKDKDFLKSRRFILFADDKTESYFHSKNDIIIEQRYFFEYMPSDIDLNIILPDGFELKEINDRLIQKIEGNITPAFSWGNSNEFLEKGKGYCVTDGEAVAAWAFSSAVSGKEIDIGVETNSDYRKRGLAAIAANAMIEYTLKQNKKPVWACHSQNIASKRLAEKLGFIKNAECAVIKVNENSH